MKSDGRSLDGLIRSPVSEDLAIWNATLWDTAAGVRPGRCLVLRNGRIHDDITAADPIPPGTTVIDASGLTLMPGIIDAHVHLMFDSGPDLLTRGPKLMQEWLDLTRGYPESREPIVRRAQSKLTSGVTTMRVLGDGYYSLALRDDVNAGDVVAPRILTAGLHVNGPSGYVSGGLAARLSPADRAESALELMSFQEIEARLTAHIARGVDVIKIATTHSNLGFGDAEPDLPEAWVREIVRVAHAHGLKVTAHSYGTAGDWAAIRGGVDGIEHLVNVPHELPDEMVEEIASRGIWVTPTLAGSAYSVMTFLRNPGLLRHDRDLVLNVAPDVRRNLYLALRLLRIPGVARLLLRQPDPIRKLEQWYDHTLANTEQLHAFGVNLAFGTDAPFTFGNFHHSIMNEVRALKAANIPNEAIAHMATTGSATALDLNADVGTLEVGMRADCILVDGNPLDDSEALGRVTVVVKEGRIVYRRTTAEARP